MVAGLPVEAEHVPDAETRQVVEREAGEELEERHFLIGLLRGAPLMMSSVELRSRGFAGASWPFFAPLVTWRCPSGTTWRGRVPPRSVEMYSFSLNCFDGSVIIWTMFVALNGTGRSWEPMFKALRPVPATTPAPFGTIVWPM